MTSIMKIGGVSLVFSLLFLGAGSLEMGGWSPVAEAQDLRTTVLQVDGMTCSACIKEIRSALLKVPGVKSADVKVKKTWLFFNDYSDARAIVTSDQGKTTVDALIKTIEAASTSMFSYHARLIE